MKELKKQEGRYPPIIDGLMSNPFAWEAPKAKAKKKK